MLYLVLDKAVAGNNLFNIARNVASSTVDIVQYRDKISSDKDFFSIACRLKKTFNNKKPFIINDRLHIAKIINADGVHLGQDDIDIKCARRILGKKAIIGLSCHNFTQIMKAERKEIDYMSIGPIFSTPIKPNYKIAGMGLLKKINNRIKTPFFAIGGIDSLNLDSLITIGISKIAVCRLLCKSNDIINDTRLIKNRLLAGRE